jgi:hypothetical protein
VIIADMRSPLDAAENMRQPSAAPLILILG